MSLINTRRAQQKEPSDRQVRMKIRHARQASCALPGRTFRPSFNAVLLIGTTPVSKKPLYSPSRALKP